MVPAVPPCPTCTPLEEGSSCVYLLLPLHLVSVSVVVRSAPPAAALAVLPVHPLVLLVPHALLVLLVLLLLVLLSAADLYFVVVVAAAVVVVAVVVVVVVEGVVGAVVEVAEAVEVEVVVEPGRT